MTDDEIIDGYVRHVNRIPFFPPPTSPAELEAALTAIRSAAEDDEYFWAWEAVDAPVDADPERSWHILLVALARCSPNHEHVIGAGPLEELLIKEPRRLAERVAEELLANERFHDAFTETASRQSTQGRRRALLQRNVAVSQCPSGMDAAWTTRS